MRRQRWKLLSHFFPGLASPSQLPVSHTAAALLQSKVHGPASFLDTSARPYLLRAKKHDQQGKEGDSPPSTLLL